MEFSRISAAVLYREREELVTYRFCPKGVREPICVRKPVLPVDEINTVEELYINGLHLEQYKQHNYDARDYYLEGLRRDPGDIPVSYTHLKNSGMRPGYPDRFMGW